MARGPPRIPPRRKRILPHPGQARRPSPCAAMGVGRIDLHPWQRTAMGGELVPGAEEFFFFAEEFAAGREPFFGGDDGWILERVIFHGRWDSISIDDYVGGFRTGGLR